MLNFKNHEKKNFIQFIVQVKYIKLSYSWNVKKSHTVSTILYINRLTSVNLYVGLRLVYSDILKFIGREFQEGKLGHVGQIGLFCLYRLEYLWFL